MLSVSYTVCYTIWWSFNHYERKQYPIKTWIIAEISPQSYLAERCMIRTSVNILVLCSLRPHKFYSYNTNTYECPVGCQSIFSFDGEVHLLGVDFALYWLIGSVCCVYQFRCWCCLLWSVLFQPLQLFHCKNDCQKIYTIYRFWYKVLKSLVMI